ncbi:hypothetical protein ACP4OV_010661 [Aristida adscensionis]
MPSPLFYASLPLLPLQETREQMQAIEERITVELKQQQTVFLARAMRNLSFPQDARQRSWCGRTPQGARARARLGARTLDWPRASAAAADLPSSIRALLSKSGSEDDETDRVDKQRLRALASGVSPGDDWSMEGLRCTVSKIATLRMKLEEDDEVTTTPTSSRTRPGSRAARRCG